MGYSILAPVLALGDSSDARGRSWFFVGKLLEQLLPVHAEVYSDRGLRLYNMTIIS